jgi:signal transduction histidine kinase
VGVPAWLAHEVQQIAREAVANGVRQGGAKKMTFAAVPSDDGVAVAISDDGTGFPVDKAGITPWSLYGRVKSLGGTMALASDGSGTRIEIVLPREERE